MRLAPLLPLLIACACASNATVPGELTSFPDAGVVLDGGTDPATLPRFSFFVTSLRALQELSGRSEGFGGDLRYGESGAGAGLRGADKLCAVVAERSLPGASSKVWRAFLSTTDADAIDRIGTGPWYDRLGRLVASNVGELTSALRPPNAHVAIKDDLPNEDGVPNHAPDPAQGEVDNHRVLTGSTTAGRLYDTSSTCLDWTSGLGLTSEGKPRAGHSWIRTDRPAGHPPPGGGAPKPDDKDSWMSAMNQAGCGAGLQLTDGKPEDELPTVGAGGGYGGIYCFALHP